MNYKYLLVLALAAGTNCYAQKNVVFHPEAPASDNVVRIYLDRFGNVYPKEKKYDVKDNLFYSPDDGNVADLKSYYTMNDRKVYAKMQRHYHLKNFGKIQDTMVNEYAAAINAKLQQGGKLVVLIHGFNNPDPSNDYRDMEEAVTARVQNSNIVFLEVYWDGMKTKKHDDAAYKRTWEMAQPNSEYAALTMRKVVNQVENGDVYVMTHSLGANVGTGMLFNVHGKKGKGLGSMAENIYTPKQSTVILAMIAPAIDGTESFESIRNTVPDNEGYNYKKIVVGYNSNDYTVAKGTDIHPTEHYADLLGCNMEEVRRTEKEVKKYRPLTDFDVTDFTYDSFNMPEEAMPTNTLALYLQSPKFKEFMDYTFGGVNE